MYIFELLRKRILTVITILSISLAVVLAVAGTSGSTLAAGQTDQTNRRELNVTGTGTVTAAPDIAYVTLGVVTEGVDAKAAQQKNAELMAKVVSDVKLLGVKAEDIKTIGYSIQPKYSYNKDTGESSIAGYSVTNTVEVTVRNISKAGNIIDIAAESGANISNSISFGLTDKDTAYREALKKAALNAKQKAQAIAEALGLKLKSPVSITENSSYDAPMYVYGGVAAKADSAMSTPVESGTINVKATVSMVYEY